MVIEKRTTEIVITSDRLIYKRGWIARHVEEIALNRIEEVVLDQAVMGRLLGYGRIVVAGTGRGVIGLPSWSADPVRFRRGCRTEKLLCEGTQFRGKPADWFSTRE